jgi:hypothetical protein
MKTNNEENISIVLKPQFAEFWKENLSHLPPEEVSTLEFHFNQLIDKINSVSTQSQIDRETQVAISSIENGTFFADPEIFKNSFVQRFRSNFSLNKTDPLYCGVYYSVQNFDELLPGERQNDFVPFFPNSFKKKETLLPDLSSEKIQSLVSTSGLLTNDLRFCSFPSVFHHHISSLALANFLFFLLRDLNSIDNFEEEIRKYLLARQRGSFNQINLLEAVGLNRFITLNPDFKQKFQILIEICSSEKHEGNCITI